MTSYARAKNKKNKNGNENISFGKSYRIPETDKTIHFDWVIYKRLVKEPDINAFPIESLIDDYYPATEVQKFKLIKSYMDKKYPNLESFEEKKRNNQ